MSYVVTAKKVQWLVFSGILRSMILELITYLRTRCPDYVRKMGYLYQAIALRERYRRRARSWQPHLEKTKSFIQTAATNCKNRKKIVLLGSGLLLDVPLEFLAQSFEEVILVDVVHLPEIKKRIKRFANVRTLQKDVTNVADNVFRAINEGRNTLPLHSPDIPEMDQNTSMVVSLNILSQLSAVPQDYIIKKEMDIDEQALTSWCDEIREAHYRALQNLGCDVCLIADHAYVYKDREGRVIEQGSTVGNMSLPKPDASWWWEIAPLGEASKKSSKELFVGAWHMRAS